MQCLLSFPFDSFKPNFARLKQKLAKSTCQDFTNLLDQKLPKCNGHQSKILCFCVKIPCSLDSPNENAHHSEESHQIHAVASKNQTSDREKLDHRRKCQIAVMGSTPIPRKVQKQPKSEMRKAHSPFTEKEKKKQVLTPMHKYEHMRLVARQDHGFVRQEKNARITIEQEYQCGRQEVSNERRLSQQEHCVRGI